ncbi:MAG: acyl--CoA ligase [Nitrospirales bacterium]|nr:acyl--CoA ligase [Nitrospirales bacterium]
MKEGTYLQSLLSRPLAMTPEKVAIRFCERALSYKELDSQSRTLASGFLDQGIRTGDRVALFLPNCPEAVMAMFACYRIGATAVPLNYRYLAEEAYYVLDRTHAKLLIFHNERMEVVDSLMERSNPLPAFVVDRGQTSHAYPLIDELFSHEPLSQTANVPSHHPALILFTSGSTGRPKGVVHSHHSAFSAIDISRRIFDFTDQDVVLVGKPISHAGGLQTQLMPTLLVGGEVVLTMKPSPSAAVLQIRQHAVTQYAMLASDLFDFIEYLEAHPTNLPTLQNCIGSGDSVPPELHHRFRDIFGWEVMEGCGMTEVSTYYAAHPRYGHRKWGSLGLVSPNTRICIFGHEGELLPIGEVGEIAIQTPSATIGYLDDPTASGELLHDGWLHTGDLGYIDEQNYVWFVGRKKLIIIRRGSNIAPMEVENLLDEHPLVHASVVVGVPDKQDGQVPVAWVVPRSSSEVPSERDLQEYVSTRLASYKNPVRYLFLNEFPLTSTGKFDRHQLEGMAVSAIQSAQSLAQGNH